MVIYQCRDDEGDGIYFGTKHEAVSEARSLAKSVGGKYDVIRTEIVPGKVGVLALANRRGWARESTVVFSVEKPFVEQ